MATVAVLLALSTALDAAHREILLRRTFWAVAWTESRGDPRAVKRDENAVGMIQIRPIMLADVNRVLGKPKYTLADRLDPEKCWQMWRIICLYYHPNGTPEQWARCWNGGPDWWKKPHTTDRYWSKVQAAYHFAGIGKMVEAQNR